MKNITKETVSEECNVSTHVFIKGDVVKNKVTEKQYLVIRVEGNSFLLGDTIFPKYGYYKKEVTISPLYVFVKHLSDKEFEDVMNRRL